MIINITKFYKFNEYVVVDRPVGMIHVYSRKNIYSGRFIYIRKKHLESLWRDYRFSKKRNYKKYSSKKIRGTFPDVLSHEYKNNVLSEFDIEYYNKMKDDAIKMIGKDDKDETKSKEDWYKYKIATMPGVTRLRIAEHMGISDRTLRNWDKIIIQGSAETGNAEPYNTIGLSDNAQDGIDGE